MWTNDDISCKWAPARVVGNPINSEDALDFIFRTDRAMLSPEYCCNDRIFVRRLCDLIGYADIPPGPDRFAKAMEQYDYLGRFNAARKAVSLEHLSSNWVASSYIFGPNGPIHPDGSVGMSINFGKWPSIEEVESDLQLIVENFPGIAFELYLWDSSSEEMVGDPDFGWKLQFGSWERIVIIDPRALAPQPSFEDRLKASGFPMYVRHETTWDITQIERMWGRRIASARKAAEESAP